jgi:hypothetical protein
MRHRLKVLSRIMRHRLVLSFASAHATSKLKVTFSISACDIVQLVSRISACDIVTKGLLFASASDIVRVVHLHQRMRSLSQAWAFSASVGMREIRLRCFLLITLCVIVSCILAQSAHAAHRSKWHAIIVQMILHQWRYRLKSSILAHQRMRHRLNGS